MKQSLQLRLGQQITMTPQLQQAIRLLQLSTLDLQLEIQQALESNIMLEVEEDIEQDQEHAERQDEYAEEPLNGSDESSSSQEEYDDSYETEIKDIPDDLSVDSNWEDVYQSNLTQADYPTGTNPDLNGKDMLANQSSADETLHDHLMWQLDLTPFSDLDRAIATAIVEAIDGDGYLRATLEDIKQSLGLGEDAELEMDEIETVLRRIQHFDPIGVAARDLSECLLLQLSHLDPDTLWLNEACQLAREHLELLGVHDYAQLTKRMRLSKEDLKEVVLLIQSLNPRPGAQIESHRTSYIIPDVFVKKIKGQWQVELNPEIAPKLRVNNHYANLIPRTDNSSDVASLKNHLQEARWFIKSLKSRHETLIKVAKCIVKRQKGFLDYGEEAMKPLVLHDIASELNMHESTISRVTTQKYIHTPRGIFELKYFFSSHVSTNNGGECSSTAIRALIKKLIAAENTAKPLSDSKIASLLSERGIKVARRTVAKYREAMVIPPSNERKRLA